MKKLLGFALCILFSLQLSAQGATIRGNVFDKESGEPIIFANVFLQGTQMGANTDVEGFFNLANVPPGSYNLVVTYLGYDSTAIQLEVATGDVIYERVLLQANALELTTVDVSGRREQARSETQVSTLQVTPKQIKSLPSTGGESDIAQYLPVLPGIITTGDQGGQLYIRGGSPVQNKILLDGLTIYNPFHSIGFFSVFETEAIRNVDVLTGGFNSEYGGRISAVVDIKTREGNANRFGGLVSLSPFQGKALVEGPIKKLKDDGGTSISYLFTAKRSIIDETSKFLYPYAVDTTFFSFATQDTSVNAADVGLPYQYTDFYGKLSVQTGNGSKLNLFGFNFVDRFDFVGVAQQQWDMFGGGANFTLVPPSSSLIIDGTVGFSNYNISLMEADGRPRESSITDYSIELDFSYFGRNNEVNYGFNFTGFNTNFSFENQVGVPFEQESFTTELSLFVKYKQIAGPVIIEPGFRLHYYASQSTLRPEPRLSFKWNILENLRFKLAGGFYSQNLISTVNDLDVVNFFVGFLAGPEQQLQQPGSTEDTNDNLQKSRHAIAGLEIDVTKSLALNVEPYFKDFTQLININRNRLSALDPEFVTETGQAYGIDFSARYESTNLYLWATYSLGYVRRDNGEQEYPTVFDRRHNVNLLATYTFGRRRGWEASLRWNLGSGFPFTQTQGFYNMLDFQGDLVNTEVLTSNGQLGTILTEEINGGRLPYYHRLDLSLKKIFFLGEHTRTELVASVTNAYNRENIFYVDRITNNRVNQLPILPSLGATFKF